jgi:HD-GYP domain-containing protein (c-di-GMP phosphodiesterase class II)
LSKNDKLSDAEYDEIKRHPAIGARILEDVPYLADLVPSIEAHHERLDGSGYGSGASGSDIPLEARVLAVADAYDAMTSTRPYRTAMPHAAAVEQLQGGRDTQFDGGVVDAFLAAFDDASLQQDGTPE